MGQRAGRRVDNVSRRTDRSQVEVSHSGPVLFKNPPEQATSLCDFLFLFYPFTVFA